MPRKKVTQEPVVEAVETVEQTPPKSAFNKEGQLHDHLKGRRIELGLVVSDKMQKTVVVSVDRRKAHPIYKKVMRRSVKFMAHDELGSKIGDTVRIIETRPMSAHKRWRVIEIVKSPERV